MAELHALEAKGEAEERGGPGGQARPVRGFLCPAESEVQKGQMPLL